MPTGVKTPLDLVRAFPFFSGLPTPIYDALVAIASSRHYAKGETLFHEGEPCKGFFFVQSGTVKIFKLAESGREQILTIQHPGDSVAELPVFDDGPYPASAAALEDAVVLFLPKAGFQALLTRHPELTLAVMRVLAQRLRKLVNLVEDLSLRGVRQRVARWLVEESAGQERFPLHSTNEELAARLGSVRDVISRTLSGLQADGFIRVKGRVVEIVDREGLVAES